MRATPMGTTPAVPWGEIRSALIVASAVVAVVELVLLRVATRTFVHIPGVALDAGPLSVVADAGRLAYYASVVLVVALLATLWLLQVRAGHSPAAAVIALFVVAAAGARVGLLDPAGVPAVVVLAVVVLAGDTIRRTRSARPTLVALTGAVVAYGVWALGSQVSTAGVELPEASTALLPVGEVLVLLGFAVLPLSLGLPRTVRRFDRVTILVAVATGLAVFMGLQLADATVKILLLWNLGLAGYLPSIAYALAGAGAAAGLAMVIRTGQTYVAAAIVMLLAGGFAMTSTYQSGLLIAAFGILAVASDGAQDQRAATEVTTEPLG